MGAENKGGSDLDIFEGLGKKSSARPSAAPSSNAPQNGGAPRTAPPPPPGGDPAKKTLLGIQSPASQSSIPAARISAAPPPPPGRGSLPQISAPPPKPSTSGMPSVVPPPAVSTRPAPLPPSAPPPAPAPVAHAGANATDMDWDDEDEATHVFDKSDLELPAKQSIRPAAGMPTPAPAPINNKQTLLGITAPLQAPPPAPPPPPASSQAPPARMSAPPPPPPSSVGAFARQSGMPGGFPPPPTINPIPSPPPTQQGIGPASLQGQTSTVPLPMPKQASLPPPAGAPNAASHGFPGTAPLPPAHAQDFRAPRSMEQTAVVRPPASKTGLWIGLAAVVALLGLGAIMFSMMMPKNGRIVVNVADAKGGSIPLVQVFVDGKKQCDATPCIADKQEAGSHAVKVIAQGYESPADQTITVEAHKDASVTFTLSSATKKTGTGLRVAGNQTGVKLFIDNKEVGPLPQELLDLTPGDHSVKIAGTERYAPVEKNVIIAKDEILDMGPTTLKVVKGKATINLNTPGARVYLVSGDDRRELPKFPISVDIDTSKSWSLEASKVGYQDYKQPISFDDGQAERTYNVELPLKGAPAPTTTATTPPPPVAQTAAPPVAPAPTPAPTPTTPPAATPVAAVGEAYLNINSIPPSSVFLDGVPLGMTPKIHQPVKPGSHRVKFMHPEAGTKEISVSVAAGETKPAVLKLQ